MSFSLGFRWNDENVTRLDKKQAGYTFVPDGLNLYNEDTGEIIELCDNDLLFISYSSVVGVVHDGVFYELPRAHYSRTTSCQITSFIGRKCSKCHYRQSGNFLLTNGRYFYKY